MNRLTRMWTVALFCTLSQALIACTGGGTASQPNAPGPGSSPNLQVAAGFVLTNIAQVPSPRELAALPNGDLLVATSASQIYIVPNAESSGAAGQPSVFIAMPESPAQGIALAANAASIYVATEHGVYQIPYHSGDQSEPNASAVKIASLRTGPISPGSDGDVHHTSSIVATASTLYVGVGSSCNACVEVRRARPAVTPFRLHCVAISS